MDEPADQRRHRSQDAPRGGRFAVLRRWAAAARALGHHWWRTLAAVVTLLGHSVRQAGRYYRRGSRREQSAHSLRTAPALRTRALEAGESRADQAVGSAEPLAETATGSAASQLPGPGADRRRLPAGDGRLQVERTAERLILSDPERDEAYLVSTVWVDVEE